MPPVIAASFESLLFLLFFIAVSAISTWLQKRRPGQKESDPMPPFPLPRHLPGQAYSSPTATGTPPAPARASSWQEELRRLLSGDEAPPSPPPTPAPVRPITPTPRSRLPGPTVLVRPIPTHGPLTTPQSPRIPQPPALPMPAMRAGEQEAIPLLSGSAHAVTRVSHIHDDVVERMRRVEAITQRHKAGTTSVHYAALAPEIVSATNLLRTPRSTRQAVIVAAILSTPKSLE